MLSVIFVLHWVAADWVIRSAAEKQMANRLLDDGYSLIETLTSSDQADQVDFSGERVSSVYNRPLSGHYYVVKVDAQVFTSPSLAEYPLDVAPIGPNQTRLYHLSGPERRPLLVLGIGLVKYGHRINISFAEDLSSVDHDITAIRLSYFALTLLILVCAIALQSWDVRRSLRPLDTVGRELEQVATGHRQRIGMDVPVEIGPLVREINRLLELVVRRLQQSRTAIGNLAHALKSPMAVLFRVAEHPVFDEYPELRQQLKSQTDNIYRYIERELKRARIAGDRQAGATSFNPVAELTALSQLLRNIHAEKSLRIRVTAPESVVHFDREDMLEMLGNLLDNACKWARFEIRVEMAIADSLTIRVEDDGPGCAEADAALLIQRGLRLDESVHGHGLGLAIVADIVDSYHGELSIGRGPALGGFGVVIRLPLH